MPERRKIRLPFKATPKQEPFVQASSMFKLGGGARGGGKSHCLCGMGVLLSFLIPGNTGYVGRAQMSDFIKTTLPILLSLIPPEILIRHQQQEHYIDILSIDGKTPSRIWYGEMADPGNLLSGNLGWFFIDEAYQVPHETFVNLAGALRGKTTLGQPRPFYGLLASNPAPGWLMEQFPVTEEEQEAFAKAIEEQGPNFVPFPSPFQPRPGVTKMIDPDYQYFPFRAADNPYNGPGYEARLIKQYAALGPAWVSRMVYGVWDATMEGLVYQLQDENLYQAQQLGKRLYRPGVPVELAGDPSNGAGVYAVAVLQKYRGRVLQVAEFYKRGGIDEDFKDWLEAQPFGQDVADGIFDPAKPDSIKRLQGWGIPVRAMPKRKDITGQINALKVLMAVDPDTRRANYIIDALQCPHTLMEFRKRVYRAPSTRNPDLRVPEQPVKAHDHILNGIEYWAMTKGPTAIEEEEHIDPVYEARAYMSLYH